MKLVLLILALVAASNTLSQDGSFGSERVNSDKRTVYLEYVCQNTDQIFLRLVNNTIWHIGVPTGKSYFPTKKPIKLGNGNKGYAIPDGEEVRMVFFVEKDRLANTRVKVPKLTLYDPPGGGRVVSKDSVIFPIPLKYLQKGLQIFVPFNYEWEISKAGTIAGEPEHRTYFRGGDISSANTEITPLPCGK